METKSRYEVISDLESQKRKLIQTRDSLNDELRLKEKAVKDMERAKADKDLIYDRNIQDLTDDLENFRATINERKDTIIELIKSVDDSLARFNTLQKKE